MINQNDLGAKIKVLREEKKMSQEMLAKKIGLSRMAISQIEQGNRKIDFLELARMAELFGLRTDYFLLETDMPEINLPRNNKLMEKFQPDKLKNIILYILEKCAGKPNVGETVLYKLLYFIDFDSFEINNKSISGLSYVHLQYGPVPIASQYLPVIEMMKKKQEIRIIFQDYYGMKIKRYFNLVAHNVDSLDGRELKIIDSVINFLSDLSAFQIEDYVHGDAPWKLTKDREVIDYHLVSKRQSPYNKKDNDNLVSFGINGAKDILDHLGPLSAEEYNYYENL
jgi:transcriptional regulator with XRE-family HTH domain